MEFLTPTGMSFNHYKLYQWKGGAIKGCFTPVTHLFTFSAIDKGPTLYF